MQTYDIHLDRTQRELTQHGSLDFPLAVYTTRIKDNVLGFIDWHWHQELQFCIVTRGVVDFSVNNEQLTLQTGEGIFINSRQLHSAKNHALSDATYACFDFHPRLIGGFEGSAMERRFITPAIGSECSPYLRLSSKVTWQKAAIDTLRLVYSNYHSSDFNELQITAWLMQMWLAIFPHIIRVPAGSGSNIKPQVKEIAAYVREHFDETLSLDAIAAQVGYAKSTCCRDFKQQLGCTIIEYQLNVRLQEASRLLVESNASIAEIASTCGFASSSYFISKFKARAGMPPRAYRLAQKAEL